MARVLLIEDDHAVGQALLMALRRQEHNATLAVDGERGLALFRAETPDIVVLDLMLPGMDGYAVCRQIRAAGDVPIIMLTARGDDIDVVAGLEAGADDYVVKPVQPRVLDARIRAVLRRIGADRADQEQYGALTVDRVGLTVTKHGVAVPLAPTEMRMLLELTRAPGRVFNRQHLLQSVWEHDYFGDSRLVDACVQRLRVKIEDDPANPVYVQTQRGFGYRFGPVP